MDDSTAATLPADTELGRTALRVADLPRLIDFYEGVVGLTVLDRGGERATLGAGERPILVLAGDGGVPERDPAGAGLYHNAFRVPSRAALGDVLGRIRDGWRLDGASDHGVSEALYLADPEGNGVEVYRDFPRGSWPRAADGRVAMGTDPLDLATLDAAAGGGDRAPPGTDLGHVHLEVASLEAFGSFYVDTLGFEVRQAAPGAVFVSAGGYHHHVGANTWNGRTAATGEHERGLSWFEVVVPDDDALAAVRRRADDRGAAVADRGDGFALDDPAGIEVRVRPDRPD